MVIERKRHLLDILTRISDSPEVREYESNFLKKYARLMNNRQSFFVNRQKVTSGAFSAVYNLLNRSKN